MCERKRKLELLLQIFVKICNKRSRFSQFRNIIEVTRCQVFKNPYNEFIPDFISHQNRFVYLRLQLHIVFHITFVDECCRRWTYTIGAVDDAVCMQNRIQMAVVFFCFFTKNQCYKWNSREKRQIMNWDEKSADRWCMMHDAFGMWNGIYKINCSHIIMLLLRHLKCLVYIFFVDEIFFAMLYLVKLTR